MGVQSITRRTSWLALCYSAAEYACPGWARSRQANKLNPSLHECCRFITGCLTPTNVNSIHLLDGIAPSRIRRTFARRMKRQRQTTDGTNQPPTLRSCRPTICWPVEIAEQLHASPLGDQMAHFKIYNKQNISRGAEMCRPMTIYKHTLHERSFSVSPSNATIDTAAKTFISSEITTTSI